MPEEWTLTPEQHRKLRHHPAVVAKITELANKLCDNANAIAQATKASQPRDKQGRFLAMSDKQATKSQLDNFAVVVQNDEGTQRPRAYVRPVGKTGLRVEAGQSVLFKAMSTMGGQ